MKIEVLTLFPEMFTAVTESSILGKAQEKGILNIRTTNIRDFSRDKHNRADDYPFGGGAGMVMLADPVFGAMEKVGAHNKKVVYMSPRGRVLNQALIEELAEEEELVILCGHYEGVDQRILDYWKAEEISIGDYILTGGELPAMVLIDSVARLLPGVLGSSCSALDESVYSGLLEYPQYTRPRTYCRMEVPEVLVSGDHKKIHLWKLEQSALLTKERRPDLFRIFTENMEKLSKEEKQILKKILEMDS